MSFLVLPLSLSAAGELQNKVVVLRRQSQPLGSPLGPEQAAKKFTVLDGFSVWLVGGITTVLKAGADALALLGAVW